jgi:hypothetical protein
MLRRTRELITNLSGPPSNVDCAAIMPKGRMKRNYLSAGLLSLVFRGVAGNGTRTAISDEKTATFGMNPLAPSFDSF